MTEQEKQDKVILLLNEMINRVETQITYGQINKGFPVADYPSFEAFEKENPEVGLTSYGWSILSMIATITDVLCGKRLAFMVECKDGVDKMDQIVTGVCWLKL